MELCPAQLGQKKHEKLEREIVTNRCTYMSNVMTTSLSSGWIRSAYRGAEDLIRLKLVEF